MLNRPVVREGRHVSPRSLAEFELYDDVADAVAVIRKTGHVVMSVTNQPDIARGNLDLMELERMMQRLRRVVAPDGVRWCPHDDRDACACRKPKPGMLRDLATEWGVDLSCSWMVGDSWRDMEAGRAAGCRTIFLDREGVAGVDADHTVRSLSEAAEYISRSQRTA